MRQPIDRIPNLNVTAARAAGHARMNLFGFERDSSTERWRPDAENR
jgi:hypothetical protein